jgi:virginiamycin B lyase
LPWGIEISRSGDVWFTEAGPGRIGQLIVNRPLIKEFALSSKTAVPRMIAEAPNGSHWFTEEAANKIGNITDDGLLRELPIPTQFSRPYGICTDSHGTVWFTEQALNPEPPAHVAWGGNKIGRIDRASNISEYDVPTSRSVPWTMTIGRFDRPWFVELTGGQLGEVNSSGYIQEFPLPRTSKSDIFTLPKSVTIHANGQVTRDDSSSVAPVGIAISHSGDIWFLETETNRVARIRSVGD